MRRYLIFKLLAINLVVIAFVMVVVWLSIDTLAAGYFVTLMKQYNISPRPAHAMFVHAVHRYLIWTCLGAAVLAVVLSYAMTRRVLAPLSRMTAISRKIAAGDFTIHVPVHTADEVGQLARAFNRMADSLRKLETLRRNLMIDVAHELRTPLTNMRGYLEALNDSVLPPSTETFSLLLDETLRLNALVEDVLQLARADAAHDHLALEPANIKEMIEETLKPFSRVTAEKSVSVKIDTIDADDVSARLDRTRIRRVLRSLVDNAVRYAPENTEVVIRIESGGQTVRVTSLNLAGGLPESDLPYLFERFYRGEKSRSREHGGAGIGLAIVKAIVEAHGGKVGAHLHDGLIGIWFELPQKPLAASQADTKRPA